ncbi:MAG: CRISPR-associated protein Cas4 [Lactobacillales bacterium]|jgi:CRISPR-associated exonuclease Cas4|nr:CRISPR-associated protein Cas4 [Lactobacillales bacterium]
MEKLVEDYLMLSGIQHFSFCKRQWALIHIENQWEENLLTVDGQIMHKNAHNPLKIEKRKDRIITHEMNIISHNLSVVGKCDVVEFYKDNNGVNIAGHRGLWSPYPVEYKRGKSKVNDCDRLQLCGQAICLEEMLLCDKIKEAAIYYGEPRRREVVKLTDELREEVLSMLCEMNEYYNRGYTPRVKWRKSCQSCSLQNICLPKMPSANSVSEYIRESLVDD